MLYLDCSKEHLVEQLEREETKEKEKKSFVFEREGITIAKRVALQEIRGWRQRNYRFVVCDLGVSSPMDTDSIFSAVFHVGAVTELTVKTWRQRLSVLEQKKEQRHVILLTGGELHQAEELSGGQYRICRMETFQDLFYVSGNFSRQMKRMLKNK